MAMSFHVVALRDAEAPMPTSQSDIPGLVVEADTFEEFVALVEDLAPEVIATNLPLKKGSVPFSFPPFPFLFSFEKGKRPLFL